MTKKNKKSFDGHINIVTKAVGKLWIYHRASYSRLHSHNDYMIFYFSKASGYEHKPHEQVWYQKVIVYHKLTEKVIKITIPQIYENSGSNLYQLHIDWDKKVFFMINNFGCQQKQLVTVDLDGNILASFIIPSGLVAWHHRDYSKLEPTIDLKRKQILVIGFGQSAFIYDIKTNIIHRLSTLGEGVFGNHDSQYKWNIFHDDCEYLDNGDLTNCFEVLQYYEKHKETSVSKWYPHSQDKESKIIYYRGKVTTRYCPLG